MENSFNKTILLVEDDVIIALGKKNELENYGYNVLTAYTGNKAIAVSEDNNDIDLILMDIDLGPGIDGTIAAEIILKNRDIPVVFMSSHTEPEIIKKTERITSYGYVVKSSIFTVLDASIKMAFKLFDAYKKLNESEERRKEAQRITHLGDWELNLRTGELFWSDEIYRMFDLDPNDFKPDYQAFLANIHPDDREFVNNAYNNSVESKVPYNINHRLLQKNGKVRTVNVRCETFYDDNSIPLRSIGTILDITEQKQMEKDLSEANTIINRSPVVAFLWKHDEDWSAEYVSENVEKLFGYSAKEFMESKISYRDVIEKNDLKRVVVEVAKFSKMKNIETFTHEPYRIITKHGDIKWVKDETYLRRDPFGMVTHYEGIVYDITNQKKLEEELRRDC